MHTHAHTHEHSHAHIHTIPCMHMTNLTHAPEVSLTDSMHQHEYTPIRTRTRTRILMHTRTRILTHTRTRILIHTRTRILMHTYACNLTHAPEVWLADSMHQHECDHISYHRGLAQSNCAKRTSSYNVCEKGLKKLSYNVREIMQTSHTHVRMHERARK